MGERELVSRIHLSSVQPVPPPGNRYSNGSLSFMKTERERSVRKGSKTTAIIIPDRQTDTLLSLHVFFVNGPPRHARAFVLHSDLRAHSLGVPRPMIAMLTIIKFQLIASNCPIRGVSSAAARRLAMLTPATFAVRAGRHDSVGGLGALMARIIPTGTRGGGVAIRALFRVASER